jgi:membrane-associated HD superfamily phosphohydrolase
MGLFNVDFTFNSLISYPEEQDTWPFYLIIFLLVAFIIAIVGFVLYKAKCRTSNISSTLISLFVLVIILCIIPSIDAGGKYRPNGKSAFKKIAKYPLKFTKTTVPFVASAFAYFGLDAIAQYFIEEPDLVYLAFAIIGILSIMLILFLIKIVTNMYRHFKPSPPNISNPNHMEMTDISVALSELIQRSNPPHI